MAGARGVMGSELPSLIFKRDKRDDLGRVSLRRLYEVIYEKTESQPSTQAFSSRPLDLARNVVTSCHFAPSRVNGRRTPGY